MEIGHRHDWKKRVWIDLRKKYLASFVITSYLMSFSILCFLVFCLVYKNEAWIGSVAAAYFLLWIIYFFSMAWAKCPKCEHRFFHVKTWVFGFVRHTKCDSCGLSLY